MWGFHDRLLTLRKALHTLLTQGNMWPAIYRRWRFQSHLYNTQFGLILNEAEWQDEWKSVLKLASSEPRHPSNASNSSSESSQRRRSRLSMAALPSASKDLDSQGESSSASSTASNGSSTSSMMYESLEEIHVLALAHVLRRPIIVVADTILRVRPFILLTANRCKMQGGVLGELFHQNVQAYDSTFGQQAYFGEIFVVGEN